MDFSAVAKHISRQTLFQADIPVLRCEEMSFATRDEIQCGSLCVYPVLADSEGNA